MEGRCKVFHLKTAMTAAYDVLRVDPEEEPMSTGEEGGVINKALCVLREMEEEWEADHLSPGIRDKIHLLAYYLGRLPKP